MEEEFLESEIMFSDDYNIASESGHRDLIPEPSHNLHKQSSSSDSKNKKENIKKTTSTTTPICIRPDYNFKEVHIQASYNDDVELEEELDGHEAHDGKIVPPHVIVAKRIAAKMTTSVYAASGRALRGRDLCQLRNSILRMTGFLET